MIGRHVCDRNNGNDGIAFLDASRQHDGARPILGSLLLTLLIFGAPKVSPKVSIADDKTGFGNWQRHSRAISVRDPGADDAAPSPSARSLRDRHRSVPQPAAPHGRGA